MKKAKRGSVCGNCGELGTGFEKCGGCKQIVYCGRCCQKLHWPKHKSECKKQKKQLRTEKAQAGKFAAKSACVVEKVVEKALVHQSLTDADAVSVVEVEKASASKTRLLAADNDDLPVCAVCLESLIDKGTVIQLACSHEYHRSCINALRKYGINDVCPQCRVPLPPGAAELRNKASHLLARAQGTPHEKLKLRLFTEIEDLLQQAISADPDYALNYLTFGLYHMEMKNVDQAISAFNRVLVLDPQIWEAHHNLANAFSSYQHNYDAAIDASRKAISIQPDCAGVHCMLGNLLGAKCQWIEPLPRMNRPYPLILNVLKRSSVLATRFKKLRTTRVRSAQPKGQLT
jgi:tetratricopeptide (TPR) repeat protein